MNSIRCLNNLKQSVWLDDLTRGLIGSGKLKSFIQQGVSGVTFNLSAFFRSIQNLDSNEYNSDIRDFILKEKSFFKFEAGYSYNLFDYLVINDVICAADMLRPIYNKTDGRDGYVSIDLDPCVAYRFSHSLFQARWLWRIINRPNIMIKIPVTPAGIKLIQKLTSEGININATLIFTLDQYEKSTDAYISGLYDRLKHNLPIHHIRSVSSVFISRMDSAVDMTLEKMDFSAQKIDNQSVLGYCGIATAKILYDMYKVYFSEKRFLDLQKHFGAWSQDLVWASVEVKNDNYDPLKYMKSLVGNNTILSASKKALQSLLDSEDNFENNLDREVSTAYNFVDDWLNLVLDNDGLFLNDLGIDLMNNGVEMAIMCYDEIIEILDDKLVHILGQHNADY